MIIQVPRIGYPNLKLKEEGIVLGRYDMMRKNFLKEHYKYRFEIMLIKGELFTHCKAIEKQAVRMKETIINQYMSKDYDIIQSEIIAENIVVNELIRV